MNLKDLNWSSGDLFSPFMNESLTNVESNYNEFALNNCLIMNIVVGTSILGDYVVLYFLHSSDIVNVSHMYLYLSISK